VVPIPVPSPENTPAPGPDRTAVVVAAAELDALVAALARRGWHVYGPVARDGAIVLERIERASDLPVGYEDVQAPGRYRLERKDHGAYFAFTVGPHSWKKIFHVPVERLFQVRRKHGGMEVVPDAPDAPPVALLGARPCELAAVAVQDRVLAVGEHADPRYVARRQRTFVVALNCGRAGGTCFCASMGTGPRAAAGYDLALTELIGDGDHRFLVEVGSADGAAVVAELAHARAAADDLARAAAISAATAASMGRHLDTLGLKERLQANLEHPRWDDVASRCLACTNCTLVCPTCFCSEVVDTTDLAGEVAERTRRWDSCFNLDFSHVHGGSTRSSVKSRYRQWLTHKLASWHDQFGESGCVGCGRCITWCPVGIDITAEAAAVGAAAPTAEGGQP